MIFQQDFVDFINMNSFPKLIVDRNEVNNSLKMEVIELQNDVLLKKYFR